MMIGPGANQQNLVDVVASRHVSSFPWVLDGCCGEPAVPTSISLPAQV